MWKTGDPDTMETATPKRVRTSRPKYSDTIRLFVNGGSIWQTIIMTQQQRRCQKKIGKGSFFETLRKIDVCDFDHDVF